MKIIAFDSLVFFCVIVDREHGTAKRFKRHSTRISSKRNIWSASLLISVVSGIRNVPLHRARHPDRAG